MNYSSFFDSWSPIFDDRGLPLVGKIEFCEANTTYNLKTVYGVDGQPIDNPVYCNVVPSTQIILGEGDYTVRYYKYIGSGNMISDKNESSWYLYKTELVKGAQTQVDKVTETVIVNTISELKNIRGMVDGQKVLVLGYNEAGDCPSRIYTWIANSMVDDDGGVKINSLTDNTGHWIMNVTTSYIDVRWYNDFGDRSSKPTTQKSNLGQRALAAIAANELHKDLYFPNDYGRQYAYYMFDGSNTVSVTKDIICDNGVRFVVKNGTVGTSIQCHELHKCEKYLMISESQTTDIGGYSLVANWINTSWFSEKDGEKLASGARIGYVIDYLNSALDFADTKIKIERDGLNKANVAFRNCEFIDCYKNINVNTIFKGMEIEQKWFADDFDFITNCSFSSCILLLENFNDADTFIKIKNKVGDYNYGDLNEQTLHDVTIYPGTESNPSIIENCTGSVILSTKSGHYEMHNASLTLNGTTNNKTFNLVDCWITIPSNVTIKSIYMRRGALQGNHDITVLNVLCLDNVDIVCSLTFDSIKPELKNCTIYKDINQSGSIIDFNIDGCKFISGYHNLTGTSGSNATLVNGSWTNNYSELPDSFVSIDDYEPFNMIDVNHKYIYSGNTGANTLPTSFNYVYLDTTNRHWINSTMIYSETSEAIEIKNRYNYMLVKSSSMIPTIARNIWEGVFIRDPSIFENVNNKPTKLFSIGNAYVPFTVNFSYASSSSFDWSTVKPFILNMQCTVQLVLNRSTHKIDLSPLSGEVIGTSAVAGSNWQDSSVVHGDVGSWVNLNYSANVIR